MKARPHSGMAGLLDLIGVGLASPSNLRLASPGQQSAIGSESESVDDIFARSPNLFGRALGADAINAAGELLRKSGERLLRLDLAAGDYATAAKCCRSLRRGEDNAGSLSAALLFANR